MGELLLAQEDGLPDLSSPDRIVEMPIHPQVVVEPGPLVALDVDSAEELHIKALEEGRGVGWVLFDNFKPQIISSRSLAALAGRAVAFPVRILTYAIVPAYLVADTPEAVLDMMPLGLERLTLPFFEIANATFSCWV